VTRTRQNQNLLILASSEENKDLFYATRFLAPDPFVFVRIGSQKYLLMSDLEIDRARKQAQGCRVLSFSALQTTYEKKHGQRGKITDLLGDFLKTRGVKNLLVPAVFPIQYADLLRKKGLKIRVKPDPFFESRTVKSAAEIRAITQSIRCTERAFGEAVRILRKTSIRRGRLYWQGQLLTSEKMKQILRRSLLDRDCLASRPIVACGPQSMDPHHEGSGPLYAHQPILFDIFPRHLKSQYFGDFSRTVVRGKPAPKLKKMYAAVQEAQRIAFRSIRHGANARHIHLAIQKYFEASGFPTGTQKGRMQGFFHGTGHGLGLEIHEPPRFGLSEEILKAGQVITVEPGLYYADTGGVRLEDVVVVTRTGCRNLTRFPKKLVL